MDKKLLSILCCPVSHKGLSVMKKDQLQRINDAIDAGGLVIFFLRGIDTRQRLRNHIFES